MTRMLLTGPQRTSLMKPRSRNQDHPTSAPIPFRPRPPPTQDHMWGQYFVIVNATSAAVARRVLPQVSAAIAGSQGLQLAEEHARCIMVVTS